MTPMEPWLAVLLAYAAGCVSFAVLVGRWRGVDVRAHGSGNPGATNVGRILGRGWGAAVLALDLLKGLLPVALLGTPWPAAPGWFLDGAGRVPVLAAAVLGHVLPVTAGFRGGKGVATFVGGGLAFAPWPTLLAVAAHLVVKRAAGVVSLASLVLVWLVVALVALQPWWGGAPRDGAGTLAALALLITWRHKDNLRRMREGREHGYDGPSDPSREHRKP